MHISAEGRPEEDESIGHYTTKNILLPGDNINRTQGKHGETPGNRISSSEVGPANQEKRLVTERWLEAAGVAISMPTSCLPDS